jgi:hypothetical protein
MEYHIKNPTHRAKAFKVHGGLEEVGPKSEGTIDVKGGLTDEFISLQALEGVVITPVGGEADEPAKTEVGAYEARETSPGWFKIHDANGNAIGKSMREEEAKAFNALSDADKAAAVSEMEA